jgi:hypothetical protein
VVQQLAEGGGGVRPPDEGENGREVDTGQADPGARAQVARRQPDGSWLRVLDYPELGRSST